MRERPCPFTEPMVRSIVRAEEPKRQTRRVARVNRPGAIIVDVTPEGALVQSSRDDGRSYIEVLDSPWKVGDRLWVRESWRALERWDAYPPRDIPAGEVLWFEADGPLSEPHAWGRLRPPMFMPRWASRILLEVTQRRGERLHAITEADCIAEGCIDVASVHELKARRNRMAAPDVVGIDGHVYADAFAAYRVLWDRINGGRPGAAWSDAPWVWAYTFKDVTP